LLEVAFDDLAQEIARARGGFFIGRGSHIAGILAWRLQGAGNQQSWQRVEEAPAPPPSPGREGRNSRIGGKDRE
jgi:hypothetical protein